MLTSNVWAARGTRMLRSTVDNYQGREQLHSLCMPEFCPQGVVLLYKRSMLSEVSSSQPRASILVVSHNWKYAISSLISYYLKELPWICNLLALFYQIKALDIISTRRYGGKSEIKVQLCTCSYDQPPSQYPNTIFGTFSEHRPWPLLYPIGTRTVSLAEYTPLRIVLVRFIKRYVWAALGP